VKATITHLTPVSEWPEYFTVKETCAILRTSKNVVYAAVKSGQLPSRCFAGHLIRIPRSALIQGLSAEVKG
jgi:excisionase family DNA binding protein